MKSKITLLLLIFFTQFLFAQTQIGIMKDPEWHIPASYDSKSGSILNLSNNSTAMIVGAPKLDFAIVNIDQKLVQNWFTPLSGFPLGIGKFKNNILVVAATDRSFFRSFSGSYKAYLLEEKTGKLLSEKIIYEGNPDYVEDPEFFFASDGSYFRMAVRLTSLKRKVNIIAPSKSDKSYRSTQNFSIINFDDQLNQREKIEPRMPAGEIWTTSNSTDGGLFIASVDQEAGKINASTYIQSSAEPLKTVSIPFDLKKGKNIGSVLSIAGSKPMTNYLSIIYPNTDKETTLLTAKIDFTDGSLKTTKEVFDNKHVKELHKSFIPVNKKFDDLKFLLIEYLSIKQMEEYGDKLLVSVASSFIQSSSNLGSIATEGSILMNVYDQGLKTLYHQFIPRTYLSINGEGSKIAYSLKNNTLRMIGNMRNSTMGSLTSLYAEMDFTTGQMIKINKIPDSDIKSGYYVNTESVSWFDQSILLPYFDKQRILSAKLGVQMQLLNY